MVLGIAASAASIPATRLVPPSQPNRGEGMPLTEITRIKTRRDGQESAEPVHGRGDDSMVWSFKWIRLRGLFEVFLPRACMKISQFSQTAANTASEANYLRAISGVFSLALYPIAFILGALAYTEFFTNKKVSTLLILAIATLGIFDPLAGVVLIFVVASRLLLNLAFFDLDNLRTLLWICFISLAPIFIAKSIRPLTRFGHNSLEYLWERFVDILLGSLVTSWILLRTLEFVSKSDKSAFKIVGLENRHDTVILLSLVLIVMMLRYLLEDLVLRTFPWRLSQMNAKFSTNRWRLLVGSIALASLFTFNLLHIFDPSWYIPTALSIAFVLPSLLNFLPIKPLTKLNWLNIDGSAKIVSALAIAAFVNKLVKLSVQSKTDAVFLLTNVQFLIGITVLLIPLIIFPLLEFLFREENRPVAKEKSAIKMLGHMVFQSIFIAIIFWAAFRTNIFENAFDFIKQNK